MDIKWKYFIMGFGPVRMLAKFSEGHFWVLLSL